MIVLTIVGLKNIYQIKIITSHSLHTLISTQAKIDRPLLRPIITGYMLRYHTGEFGLSFLVQWRSSVTKSGGTNFFQTFLQEK